MVGKTFLSADPAARSARSAVLLAISATLFAPGILAAQTSPTAVYARGTHFVSGGSSFEDRLPVHRGGLSISFQVTPRAEGPPSRSKQVASQLLIGTVVGLGGALAGGALGYGLDLLFIGDFVATGAGAGAGWILGSAMAVHRTGRDDHENASFPATLAGSALGGLTMTAGAGLVLGPAFLVGPAIGGAIGYQLTRYPVITADEVDRHDPVDEPRDHSSARPGIRAPVLNLPRMDDQSPFGDPPPSAAP